jgi:hypothetical protein
MDLKENNTIFVFFLYTTYKYICCMFVIPSQIYFFFLLHYVKNQKGS